MFKKGIEYLKEPYRQVISHLLNELLQFFSSRLISLVVFGSVARGEARKDSDIDVIIIIKDLPKSRLARSELFSKIEDNLEHVIQEFEKDDYYITFSPIVKTPEEAVKISPIYLDIVEDGVIIFDKNSLFENILKRLKKRLEELGAERIWIGRKWYWILKKDFKFGEVVIIE